MKALQTAPGIPAILPGREEAPRSNSSVQRPPRLKDIYDGYFETVLAGTEEERQCAFRLRYNVYCVEHPFEPPEQNPGGMEIDAYDGDALHALLLHRETRDVVGTVRLILPESGGTPNELPIRHVCHHELVVRDNKLLPRANTAEISRFAVSKKFRRREDDNDETAPGGKTVGRLAIPDADRRRNIPNTSLGLMQAIVWMAAKAGVTHLCAVMEPTLLRMLRRLGIHFIPIGPLVEYHGRRQPCYSHLDTLLARIWVERAEVWELVTRDGTLWPLNRELAESLRKDRTESKSVA